MKPQRLLAMLSLLVAFVAFVPVAAQNTSKRPMTVDDILAFRAMGATALSQNGQWFAYRVAPQVGDGEVIVRSTTGDKEMKFPVGEGAGTMSFSEDGAYIGISVGLPRRQAQAAQRANQPVQNSLLLVNLATGEKTSIPKIRRFSFNGEMGGWVALDRYPPTPAAAGGAAPAAAAGGGRGGGGGGQRGGAAPAAGAADAPRDTRPRGNDLILHDLKTGTDLNVGNVSEFAFDKSGKRLAMVIDAADQIGNGVQLRDMSTGMITTLETDRAFFERMSWAQEGDALLFFKGRDDRAWRERLFSIVGYTGMNTATPTRVMFDPSKDAAFPKDMAISGNRPVQWTEARDAFIFGIAPLTKAPAPAGRGGGGGANTAAVEGDAPPPAPTGAAAASSDTTERPNLMIWHYKDPRLQSQQQVQETADRNFTFTSIYRISENKFVKLADDRMKSIATNDKGKWAISSDNTDYELMGNLDGRTYRDVYAVNMQTGERKLIKKQLRWGFSASPDGARYLYYENRNFYVYDTYLGEARNITASVPASFIDTEDDHNVVDPPVSPVGWSSDNAYVLLSDRYDVWKVPVGSGSAVNLTGNGRKDGIKYRTRVRVDPQEKGIDLSKPQYFSAQAEWTKKGGYAVVEPGQPGAKMLLWDDAVIGRLQKADKGSTWIYSRETPTQAADIYVTNAQLTDGRRITNMTPEADAFLWTSGVQLIEYKNAKGERLQGSLYLPANYEKGKQYPLIVYIYERLTQDHFQYGRPTANGFNRQAYTSNGYAVLLPDIKYYVNDPGMSAVWAIVPAVKAAVGTGIVDAKHVGLQGHSWGGYQTAFTITQTDIFAAAVAGAPLTDMISMYSLIYKNSGGTNGAIFESSQGRFTGGPWEQWEAYTRNSPVAFAKNVKTPLMILHNDADGAVDFTQGIEYYDTLRRMGKPVVLLEYPGENHSLARPGNQQDYTIRMKQFFDHLLKDVAAPDWLENGVPRLKMQEHIDQMLKERQDQQKAVAPAPAASGRGGGGR